MLASDSEMEKAELPKAFDLVASMMTVWGDSGWL